MYSHKLFSHLSSGTQIAVILSTCLTAPLLSTAGAATVTYPAENAVRAGTGTVVETTNAGFHGTGYVNFPTSGGSLTFNGVDGGTGGNATISIRAALGTTTSRTGVLVVNGASRSITFTSTGAWTTWADQSVVASLNSGTTNTIVLESNGQDLANIDEIAVTTGATLPNVTIWIAGDSTVATGGPSCPFGWGGQFAPLFDNRVTVVNSAVAGRSIRTWLYDVSDTMDSSGECILNTDSTGQPIVQAHWTAMLNGMKSGDYLFIQFGINDSSATCNRHVGLIAFQASLGLMAQAAKARGAHPIFVTPVSAIKCSGNTAVGTRGSYVTATEQAGVTYGVPVIELHGLSVALYNSLAFCPLPGGATDVTASTGGAVGAFFCNDHTHFDLPGAPQIAELVAKALRDQGIGLAAYLK
jgi:lysophospholipase L1-like esterase